MMRVLKYGAALFPGVVWLVGWVAAVLYKSASAGFAYVLLLATFVAAVTSLPVVIVALAKLRRGADTPWVVVSLIFSLPVLILSVIALTATVTRADMVASNCAAQADAREVSGFAQYRPARAAGCERYVPLLSATI